MLKYIVDTLEETPEELRHLYAEKDGKFTLQITDAPDFDTLKTKITEFRDNNVELMKKLNQAESDMARYKEIDPDKYKEMAEALQQRVDQKKFDDGKLEELLEERTQRMKTDYEGQLEQIRDAVKQEQEKAEKLRGSFAAVKIDSVIQFEVTRAHVPRKGAMQDILNRGRGMFQLDENNEPVAMDRNGVKVMGRDGITPLSIKEWAKDLPNDAAHFFEGTFGIGSQGGAGGGSGDADRLKNIKDPAERIKNYRRMKAAGGGRK
jgi:hypothetical protein